MEIVVEWTPTAQKGLDGVIQYLEINWTGKEILQLEENIESFIDRIKRFPKMFPATKSHKNTRKGMVDKHNYIVYRIQPRKRCIQIINFRGYKQKPLQY